MTKSGFALLTFDGSAPRRAIGVAVERAKFARASGRILYSAVPLFPQEEQDGGQARLRRFVDAGRHRLAFVSEEEARSVNYLAIRAQSFCWSGRRELPLGWVGDRSSHVHHACEYAWLCIDDHRTLEEAREHAGCEGPVVYTRFLSGICAVLCRHHALKKKGS